MEENNFYYRNDPNGNIKFDSNHLNSLISAKKYREASDYFKQFESTNALERARQLAKINELDEADRVNRAVYSNLSDEQIAKVNFSNVILKKGGIDELRYAKDEGGHYIYKDDKAFSEANPLAATFEQYYSQLGSSFYVRNSDEYKKKLDDLYGPGFIFGMAGAPDLRKNDAVSLKVTIPKTKYGSINWKGKHPVIRRNNYRDEILNEVKAMTGATVDDLKQSGIMITEEDNGDLTFIYDKVSDYGKALTIAIGKHACGYNNEYNLPQITGYDKDGNEIVAKASPYRSSNVLVDAGYMRSMSNTYDIVSDVKTQAFVKNKNLERDVSSTSFNISAIQSNEDKRLIIEDIKSMAFADYEHYGYLDSDDGETLKFFDDDDFRKFRAQMNGRGIEQIHLQGMVVNGITGVLITLDPKLDKDNNPKGTEMKMFIPNYLNSLTSYDIHSSTDLQALMEYTNMLNYGQNYQYKFDDGSKAYIDESGIIRRVTSDGRIYMDNSSQAKQDLIRDIDRDFILKQANMQIGKYMNNKGQYDMNSVRNDAMIIAYNGADELYPNVPLTTISGKEITVEDIFDDKRLFMQTAEETCNAFVLKKLEEIYNIYDNIVGKAISKKNK